MAVGDTTITIVGNVVAEPELRITPSGKAVTSFRVASTPRRYDAQTNQWVDGHTLFMACTAWNLMAENVAQTLHKGMRVIVAGRLTQRVYQTESGDNRTSFLLECEEVAPSLKYATAKVVRNQNTQPQHQGGFQQQGPPPGSHGGNQWGSTNDQPPF